MTGTGEGSFRGPRSAAPIVSMMQHSPAIAAIGAGLFILSLTGSVHAADALEIAGSKVRVDITETSLLNYHFDNRNDKDPRDVTTRIDDNYGEWLNRFNATASWKAFQAGLRFDTATYFHRPQADDFETRALRTDATRYLAYRYRDQYLVDPFLPSKMYLTYGKPALEATVGDAYVSFGRGLVLAMRKIDELAVDTSLQGGKVVARVPPFVFTLVAGYSNPVRIDEATGTTLRDDEPVDGRPYQHTWYRDLIVGARAEAKIAKATLGLHFADINRREELPEGTRNVDPPAFSKDIQGAGLSLAIPKVAEALPLDVYTEVAVQNRIPFESQINSDPKAQHGYGAYGSVSMTRGIVTGSLEGKHYRAFYPVRLNMADRYTPFRGVQYNAPPTVELVTQDSLFDNSCTSGGRARVDVRATASYLVYASAGRFENWGEVESFVCGIGPGLGFTQENRAPTRTETWDFYTGFELRSQTDSSYALMTLGTRRDENKADNLSFYREGWVQFDLVKTLTDLWSIELTGLHRNRFEERIEAWREGETYLGIKYTSKRSLFLGHEYTTRSTNVKPSAFLANDKAQHFLNIGAQFKFSDAVALRLFVGQQRGTLKCVSGVCRQFPAFEGAKAELVVRY
ncbi:MAG: hypothetical protein NVSMB1_18100 [Polyangiales bacterium]